MRRVAKWNLEPVVAKEQLLVEWADLWLVLRCANQSTLPLTTALVKLGLRAWSPVWVRRRRFPRSSLSRDVLLPCLPSFVFLAAPDVIAACNARDAMGTPGFSLMNSYGVFVRIKDKDLEGLRKVGDLDPKRANPMPWPAVGEQRKVLSGAFQGMVGKVVSHTQRHCLVEFPGTNFPVVKIPPFLLVNDEA